MAIFRTTEEKKLVAALEEHGASGPWVRALDAWQAFKRYGRSVKLEGGTGLLFQVGTYDFDGRPRFYFHPVCQFEFLGADGEHECFKHLNCELTAPPCPATSGVEASLWSFEYPDVDSFYTAVEALPEFQVAVGQDKYRVAINYERV